MKRKSEHQHKEIAHNLYYCIIDNFTQCTLTNNIYYNYRFFTNENMEYILNIWKKLEKVVPSEKIILIRDVLIFFNLENFEFIEALFDIIVYL